jgi:transposase
MHFYSGPPMHLLSGVDIEGGAAMVVASNDRAPGLRRGRLWRINRPRSGNRIAVAYEAGRDGFWLARWLQGQGIEAHVIHPTSVAVSRELIVRPARVASLRQRCPHRHFRGGV